MNRHSIHIVFKWILLTLLAWGVTNSAFAQSDWNVNGYVKLLGTSTHITEDIPRPLMNILGADYQFFDYQVHNRLNITYYPSSKWELHAGVRNRVFWGFQASNVPAFRQQLETDPAAVDLSYIVLPGQDVFLHQVIDRLYAKYTHKDWEITLGRQRVNWAQHTIWNPNDIFNTYSYFDFDYEERPGSDVVNITRYLSALDQVQFTAGVDGSGNLIAAGLYRFNKNLFDIQILGGMWKDDIVLGGGFAGNIKNAALKGEASVFIPVLAPENETVFSASIGYEYTFENGLLLSVNGLYNSNGENSSNLLDFLAISGGGSGLLTAKDLFPFQTTAFVLTGYQFLPLLRGDFGVMSDLGFNNLILVPTLTYSVSENTDFSLVGQFFTGTQPFSGNYGFISGSVFARIKYSF